MKFKVAYDPVTRIEGHLKIDVTIEKTEGVQKVVDAKATGGLFRGFERILIGRDPRDAQHITERICGVCPVAHGLAAVRALDSAYAVKIPANGRIMRNLVNGSNFISSHILHFYMLSLPDFINGPPGPAWLEGWDIDKRFSKSQSGSLNDHYITAVTMRRKADRMTAVFGGKVPHPPAFVPGGFTTTPRQERIDSFRSHLNELITFIENVYIPDAQLLADKYSDYFTVGIGHKNLLCNGVFDLDDSGNDKLFRRGHILDSSKNIEPLDVENIAEHVKFSWFKDADPVKPSAGRTIAKNPKHGAYSWLKAPRYDGKPYELGPLARMWVNGDYRRGISVMDRHLARAHEALKIAHAMRSWIDQLQQHMDEPVYTKPQLLDSASACGLTEAPRGALGHWLDIKNGKLSHYQVISPTTWNVSPRDDNAVPGSLEQALIGVQVANADMPVEVMRIIHSFDPCLDCATHVIRPGKKVRIVRLGYR